MGIFIGYICIINTVSLIIMYVDKQKAIHNKWRVSEKTLFILASILGSPGILGGMYLFRHKTKHIKFVLGVPIILFLQIYLYYRYSIMK